MALTKYNGATNTIQSLSDRPNQNEGLTAAQLKLKFDQEAINNKAFLNNTLTVEIDDLDAENVKKTDDQTIDGVKTFIASPIVPTPTTDMQVSTKKYVDDNFTTKSDITNNRKLSETGNFTGTLNGLAIVAADPGLSSTVAGHTTQLSEIEYYRNAQLIANTVNKLIAGKNIVMEGLGDSIMYGYYATGNLGYMEKIKSEIQSKYGVTVTLNNRAVSGYTVRDAFIFGKVLAVETSNPDIVIISFGHNDIKSDLPDYLPGQGYPLEQSLSDTEYIIRRLRSNNPSVDIILMGESPYPTNNPTSNQYLATYTKEYKILASKYNCLFLDMTPVIQSNGGDILFYDGGHPNEDGHQVIADEIMKYFVTVSVQNSRGSLLPNTSLRKSWKYGKNNWKQITGLLISDGNRAMYNGTGWAGTPKATTNATDFVDIVAKCHCVAVKMEITTGTRLLIVRDSIPWYGDVTLGSIFPASPSSFWLTIPFDSDAGVHMARLYLRSGMIKIDEIWCLDSPFEFLPCDSPLITYDANWTDINNTDTKGVNYFTKFKAPTVDSGYTVTIPFIGTGLAGDFNVQNGTGILQVSIDGGTATDLAVGTSGAYNLLGGVVVCQGLSYGQHTVTLTAKAGNTIRVRMGGFFVLDERRTEEPRTQRGYCKVGTNQLFGTPYDAIPVINVNGNGVYPTSSSKTGFTMSGTAGEIGVWKSDGSRIAY